MSSLQELDFSYKRFIDRSTILYGESGTGKSFVIVDILFQLKPHVDQIIVISPTDPQNHTYDRGIVPLPCIHYTITAKLLDDIWERQNALSAVYTKANKAEVLESLFERIGDNIGAKSVIDDINEKRKSYENEIHSECSDENLAKTKITEMGKEYEKLIILIYKHYINENRERLARMSLSNDEKFSLKYLNLNPRLVIIFDDCTDLLKKFKSHPVMQKLFYQGRWAFITVLIACHTDKALDPELKKNAFINIFTGEKSAHSYFERKSNDLDKEERQRASAACKASFTPIAKFQKLVWVREENKFYRFTATSHEDFRFGSPVIWEYCKKIQAEAGTISVDNKFIQDFM